MPRAEADATNEPGTVLAVKCGDVAVPVASVCSVACAWPPSKVAPVPRENATGAPATGFPFASRTTAVSGCRYLAPTCADCAPDRATIVAARPLAVLFNENATLP